MFTADAGVIKWKSYSAYARYRTCVAFWAIDLTLSPEKIDQVLHHWISHDIH
jgi:hypothetical protein